MRSEVTRESHVVPRLTAIPADRIDADYRPPNRASSSVSERATTVLLRDGFEP